MGRYQTEAAYLKSVLLWLQGNWTEPDPPCFYPLRAVPQVSPHYSTRRIHTALSRRDGIIDLPAFLPPVRGVSLKLGEIGYNGAIRGDDKKNSCVPTGSCMSDEVWTRNQAKQPRRF